MVWRQTLLFCTFLISFVKIQQVVCSGVFELRLKSFTNENGKDSLGQCCSGVRTGDRCVGTCRTRFRVCLKHFQQKVDFTSTCTFGDVMTPVLGDNNVNLSDTGALDIPGFTNPIKFPFDFSWPGTFSLIVEAWHDTTSGNTSADDAGVLSRASSGLGVAPGRVLLSRMSDQKWVDVKPQWTSVLHSSANSSLSFEYRVMCDAHYYGAGCANLCRPRDDNFGHYTCSSSGERLCHSGWTGDYCTTARCAEGCEHGGCSKPGECVCQIGWKGRLCSECEKYPGCKSGTCSKPWECLCDEGWGGLFCNQDLNYCTNHKPCRNGGTCFNTGQGLYTCSCPPGYAGADCDIKLSDCSHKPCLNGAACKQNGTSYQCECSKDWYGTHCEIAVQTCQEKPCKHGGTCRDTIHGYKCSCPAGFSGAQCQLVVNHCTPNPCSNGGNCTVLANNMGHKCSCPSGFSGKNCELNTDDCKGNPCRNGGSCIDLVNNYRCSCKLGYAGPLCEEKVDYCRAKPCANGGVCEPLLNDYQCKCRPGFSGKDCSVEVDECQAKPCENGGSCYGLSNGGFQCLCVSGYSGQRCENENSSPNPIFNERHVAIASVAAAAAAEDADAEKLGRGHWYIIAVLSVAVPLLVLFAALVVNRMKQRRKRDQKKADDEARMQNEQNSVHSSVTMTKRGETHMIKNTWGQCVKNVDVDNGVGDLCYPKQVYAAVPAADPNIAPYTLQRSRSQKQLNVDPPLHRHSVCNRVSCKDLDNIVRSSTPASLDNRLSVLSINISHSNLSDSSLNKQHSSQLLEKDKSVHNNTLNSSVLNSSIGGGGGNGGVGGGNSSSVYVIDEHFTQTLFATEV